MDPCGVSPPLVSPPAEYQQVIQALAANCSHEPFRV